MNSDLQLYPPLDVIRARLFGETAGVELPDDDFSADGSMAPEISMPAWLQETVAQAAAQKISARPGQPEAGQIWSLRYQGQAEGLPISGRIPLLLERQLANGCWQGWVMSGDSDYAGRDDVILNPRASAINPLLSMVQTWNAVSAEWDVAAPYLGVVDAAVLESVRAVAGELKLAHPPKGSPGNLQMRQVRDEIFALTGDYLGGARDPRWAYRRLYLELAKFFPSENSLGQEFDV